MRLTQIFWIIFPALTALSFTVPAIRKKFLERTRLEKLRELEDNRDSRVIFLIHRQETISFLGIPILRYRTVDNSEKVLRAIKNTNSETPIDLILHTPAGLMLAAEQIADALCAHPAQVNVIIPYYAMSGGTLIALAADEILIDKNGVLGPVNLQKKDMPAASILTAVNKKDVDVLEDETLILEEVGEKTIGQVKNSIMRILKHQMEDITALELAENLTEGKWTNEFPISVDEAKKLGMPINIDIPDQVYDLMELFPQSPQQHPSFQYVPRLRREKEVPRNSRTQKNPQRSQGGF